MIRNLFQVFVSAALTPLFLAILVSPATAQTVIGPPDPIPTWTYNPGGGFGGTNQLIITGTAGDDTIVLGTDQPISGYGNITINGLNTGIPLFGNPLDITVYGDPPDGSGQGGDDTIDLSAWTIGSLTTERTSWGPASMCSVEPAMTPSSRATSSPRSPPDTTSTAVRARTRSRVVTATMRSTAAVLIPETGSMAGRARMPAFSRCRGCVGKSGGR
jgi:hypothetical protein